MNKEALISPALQRAKYVISDLLTTALAIFIFNIYRYYGLDLKVAEMLSLSEFISMPKLIAEDVLIPFALLGLYWLSGFYNSPFGKSRLQELLITFISAVCSTLLIYFAILVNDPVSMRSQSYEMILVLFVILFCLTYVGRYIITQCAIIRFSKHLWSFRTIIIGNSRIARQQAFELSKTTSRLGFEIAGFVSIPSEHDIEDDKTVFDINDLPNICEELKINQLLIVPETHSDVGTMQLLDKLFPLNIPIKIWPDNLSYITQGISLQDIFGQPFVDLTMPHVTEFTKNVKRFSDVIVSTMALIILSPLLVALGICVKLSSPGKILYTQQRIGYRRKPFNIIKFRTMYEDAEKKGPRLSSEMDPRITPIGRIMRKYRLDELPQFWNVLRGEMALVGPRPERAYYISLIRKEAPWFTLLHQVRPGITSWGMVKFGYATNVQQMVRRARYDLIYISNMSIIVDIKILIYTIKTIITGKGI